MPGERFITFKDMCERFNVTPRTLRYYEYLELLSPVREGRQRLYTPREVARMTLILRGRRFGFSLEEIRQWLLIYDQKGSREQSGVWLKMAGRQIGVLDRQIADLEAARADLTRLRDSVADDLRRMG